jgi:enoyl-CoA hydratase
MEFATVLVEHDGPLGIVTLNRPRQLNTINQALLNDLASALEMLDADELVRCIIITGGKRWFALGADIHELAAATPTPLLASAFTGVDRIRRIRKPLIAAVGGYALGGGCELALHCDLIVASENAQFGQPEINLGVIPGVGGTQLLPHAIGKYLALEMILTGRTFSAQELYQRGLVNRIAPAGEHLRAAKELGMQIAAKAPIAVRLAKEAVRAALETPLAAGLSLERQSLCLLLATTDQQEGVRP